MTFGRQIAGAAALGMAMLIGGGLSVSSAQAGYVVTLEQVGSNVVATGSGAIDLTGLSFQGNTTSSAGLNPSSADISTGPMPIFGSATSFFLGINGPTSFGGGGTSFASSGSGDLVDLLGAGHLLYVPEDYVSGNPLSDTSTYDNQTFASLGVTPGTYEWSWGTGPNQNVTLNIEALGAAPVPEPSGALLFALSLGLVMLLAARRNGQTTSLVLTPGPWQITGQRINRPKTNGGAKVRIAAREVAD